jgi:predicted transcriptional regulator
MPAVPVRRSVQRDYVVCLECGFRGLMLQRYLKMVHGLDADAYRACWQLGADHPIVAPSYSARSWPALRPARLGRAATLV